MPDFADLEQRIEDACARLASAPRDIALLAEVEALLSEGYVRALQWDQRRRRLAQARYAAVVTAEDIQRLAREEHVVDSAARDLRLRLGAVCERWQALQANGTA